MGSNISRPQDGRFLRQFTWGSGTALAPVEFGEELSDNFLVEAIQFDVEYTILDAAAGTPNVINLSEANRDALYNMIVQTLDLSTGPVGQIVNFLSASELIRLGRDLGVNPAHDLEPGLDVDIPISGAGTHTGYLRFAIPFRLPHVQFRTAFCPYARQLRPGGLNITCGTASATDTFTDGNSVSWYVDAATIKISALGFQSSDRGERSPIFYDKISDTTTDNLQLNRNGYWLQYTAVDGSTRTPLELRQTGNADGSEVSADGRLVLRRKSTTALQRSQTWADGRFGRGWPTAEGPAFSREKMIGVPILFTPEASRLDELTYCTRAITVTLEAAYTGTVTHLIARVPFVLAGCVCPTGTPRSGLPGSPAGTPVPTPMTAILPRSEG